MSSRSGTAMSHAARKANGVRVDAYLSPDAAAALDELAVRDGSRTAALERAVLEAAKRLRRTRP
jgi:hypothetical protein